MQAWLLGMALVVACGDKAAGDGADSPPDGADTGEGAGWTDGSDGAEGADGADGTDGSDGTDGADGSGGTDGADGGDGTDVPECASHGTFDGDLTLTTAADLADFGAAYHTITGDLRLARLEGVTDLADLACLREVGDRLDLSYTDHLVTASLPRLRSAGRVEVGRNWVLEALSLPALTRTDRVDIDREDQLTTLDLSSLAHVEGSVVLRGLSSLASLSLPALTAVDADLMLVDLGPSATALSAPALREVGRLIVNGDGWTDLSAFSGLTALDALTVQDSATLTSLAGPAVAVTSLSLRGLEALADLTTLQAPAVSGTVYLRELAVADLSGLEHLPGGPGFHVWVVDLPQLTSLAGVEATEWSALTLTTVPALTTLDGLAATGLDRLDVLDARALVDLGPVLDYPSIGTVELAQTGLTELSGVAWQSGEALRLASNNSLETIDLDGLTALTVDLQVGSHPSLWRLRAPDLEVVGGLQITHADPRVDLSALETADSVLLTDLTPSALDLSSLAVVVGDVEVRRVEGLGAWALPSLDAIGSLEMSHNTGLTALSLPALTQVGGAWATYNNWDLVSLSAPDLVEIAGGVRITSMDDLSSLDLSSLESAGRFELDGLDALTSLSGLSSLQELSGDLHLEDLQGLTDLSGLDALHTVSGELWLEGSDGIVDLTGLEALSSVGPVRILRSDGIASLDGLSGLTATGAFVIHDLPSLTDVSALSALTSVQTFDFEDCDALESFDGLEGLRTVGSYMDLDDLDALTDVTALHGVTSVGSSLWIRDNVSLATADAQALVDAIGAASIGGTVTVSGNGAR